ncbi:MAG: ThuA domain-containing protein [Clostridia bacterium]|nr:ThuA domain-containing protein [Clostridia bacterium]
MMEQLKVTVWNEFVHEREQEEVAKIYPQGIHNAIKSMLDTEADFQVRTATLDQPEHGLTQEVLDNTDVLLWWGHMAHHKVADEIVDRVYKRVLEGMGLIVLHSGHASKIFQRLMGAASGDLKWRESGDTEKIWLVSPSHPIAAGLPEMIEIDHEETYGEHFNIPDPDEVVFLSWFSGGEVFRSGCCFHRGRGKIFYFRPGHETYPIYYREDVAQVLKNAIRWAQPVKNGPVPVYGFYQK